jgi:C4-dicarboxylate-specific signal transduction histidine kinase
MHQLAIRDQDIHRDTAAFLASAVPPQGRYESLAASIASFLSHDIRHHLTVVGCNAEFMSESPSSKADRKQLLEEVREAITSVNEVVDFILLHARSELVSKDGVHSFNELMEGTVNLIRPHPHSVGVSISIGVSPATWAVFNKTLVTSAIYNLLLNACFAAQHGNEPGRVDISLKDEDDFVCVLVRDNGSGVPQAVQQTLSQPFLTSGKQGGVGLGITIAGYVAREYGGSLRLESSRPGCTIFALRLAKTLLSFFAPGQSGVLERR